MEAQGHPGLSLPEEEALRPPLPRLSQPRRGIFTARTAPTKTVDRQSSSAIIKAGADRADTDFG